MYVGTCWELLSIWKNGSSHPFASEFQRMKSRAVRDIVERRRMGLGI
jgi:hypothetical protein